MIIRYWYCIILKFQTSMNRYLSIIIVVLIALNIGFMIHYLKYKRSVSFRLFAFQTEMTKMIPLQENWELGIENNGYQLINIKGKDQDHVFVSLDNFFQNDVEKIFVCRFSEMDCESCIDYAIKQVIELCDSVEGLNVLYLGNYRNNRSFTKQKNMYGIEACKALNVASLGMPIEDLNRPYYFVLDDSLRVWDIFVPNKVSKDLLRKYFDLILDKHYKGNNENAENEMNLKEGSKCF